MAFSHIPDAIHVEIAFRHRYWACSELDKCRFRGWLFLCFLLHLFSAMRTRQHAGGNGAFRRSPFGPVSDIYHYPMTDFASFRQNKWKPFLQINSAIVRLDSMAKIFRLLFAVCFYFHLMKCWYFSHDKMLFMSLFLVSIAWEFSRRFDMTERLDCLHFSDFGMQSANMAVGNWLHNGINNKEKHFIYQAFNDSTQHAIDR